MEAAERADEHTSHSVDGLPSENTTVEQLVGALERARRKEKPLIRCTEYSVNLHNEKESRKIDPSVVIQEQPDGVPDHGVEATTAQSGAHVILTSWKTSEFAYRKASKVGVGADDELPTLARGLFTIRGSDGARIAVRGYDKFFNEGEMPWTKEAAIAAHSQPPYELTFKENGCIIFIAALSPTRLIVTSKHALGANDTYTVSHAQKGEEWLERHLATRGRSKADLAAELWRRNETAVTELCDDDFEEHVLAYPRERTGLHLHGLNANSVAFQTRSIEEVDAFAREWGFLPTRYIVKESLSDVKKICDEVGQTGAWEGIPIEGFVVRTRMPERIPAPITTSGRQSQTSPAVPPYKAGQTWFYKVKFDEPYLMYRDWRELTRRMLSDKAKYEGEKGEGMSKEQEPASTVTSEKSSDHSKADTVPGKRKKTGRNPAGSGRPDPPRTRSNRVETKLYVEWCYEKLYGSVDGRIHADAKAFERFQENKGIIHLREEFLAFLRSSQGQKRLDERTGKSAKHPRGEQNATKDASTAFTKTVIVPIAIPACGKTALATALQYLIPEMGHTQSDNVRTKKTGALFLRNIVEELDGHNIVFADRNNHMFKHRDEIVNSVHTWESKQVGQPQRVRMVAIVWSVDMMPWNKIHAICADRIIRRGENHQSLRATADKQHEKILWSFLRQAQPFKSAQGGGGSDGYGDAAFDHVITLPIDGTPEGNLKKAYGQLQEVLRLPEVGAQKFDEAIDIAKQYKVSLRKDVKGIPIPPTRYYALAVDDDIVAMLSPLLSSQEAARTALQKLIDSSRRIENPHVTLVHNSDLPSKEEGVESQRQGKPDAQRLWDLYAAQAALPNPPSFVLRVDFVAWDEKAMVLSVAEVQTDSGTTASLDSARDWRPHITLGTFSEDVRPYEADRVVRDADAGRLPVQVVRFDGPVSVNATLRGLY